MSEKTGDTGSGSTNVDIFNRVTAIMFAELFDAFPIPSQLNSDRLAKLALGDAYWRPNPSYAVLEWAAKEVESEEGLHYSRVAMHATDWLTDCGFIQRKEGTLTPSYVLSPKGFEVLAAVPKSLTHQTESLPESLTHEGTESLGKRLKAAITKGGGEVGVGVISDLIVKAIGAFS
jgi:hypothetical protein